MNSSKARRKTRRSSRHVGGWSITRSWLKLSLSVTDSLPPRQTRSQRHNCSKRFVTAWSSFGHTSTCRGVGLFGCPMPRILLREYSKSKQQQGIHVCCLFSYNTFNTFNFGKPSLDKGLRLIRWWFTGWKVTFYGMNIRERWWFTGWKVMVYGVKGDGLRDGLSPSYRPLLSVWFNW